VIKLFQWNETQYVIIDSSMYYSLIAVILMIVLMVVMLYMYKKVKIFPLIATMFIINLVIGVNALSIENIPFTPWFQILFILFSFILFIMDAIDFFTYKK
jgi:hypothetical protein